MNKAFIFDLDGVIVNSEPVWAKIEEEFFISLLGKESFSKFKDKLIGSAITHIYDYAKEPGLKIEFKQFLALYDELASKVYSKSKLTKDIDSLISKLKDLNFKIGLVTASSTLWVSQVLPKLKNPQAFDYIVPLASRSDLNPKPSPDGFSEAIEKLGSSAKNTIILEDSNQGLAGANASKAFTICLKEHLPANYIIQQADLYIDNLSSLIKLLEIIK